MAPCRDASTRRGATSPARSRSPLPVRPCATPLRSLYRQVAGRRDRSIEQGAPSRQTPGDTSRSNRSSRLSEVARTTRDVPRGHRRGTGSFRPRATAKRACLCGRARCLRDAREARSVLTGIVTPVTSSSSRSATYRSAHTRARDDSPQHFGPYLPQSKCGSLAGAWCARPRAESTRFYVPTPALREVIDATKKFGTFLARRVRTEFIDRQHVVNAGSASRCAQSV
jgi:hypothetical protein